MIISRIGLRKYRVVVAIGILIVLSVLVIHFNVSRADDDSGSLPFYIQGQVQKDINNNLEPIADSIEIKLKNIDTGEVNSFNTVDQGLYNFSNNLPGHYQFLDKDNSLLYGFNIKEVLPDQDNVYTINLIIHSEKSRSLSLMTVGDNGTAIGIDAQINDWVDVSLPESVNLNNVTSVGNSPTVWLVGDGSGHIFKTANGGISWYDVTPQGSTSFDDSDAIQSNPNGSVVTITSPNSGRIFISTDKGDTWKRIPFADNDILNGGNMVSTYFADANKGKVLLEWSIWSTSNGGKSWKKDTMDETGYYKYYCKNPPTAEQGTERRSYMSWQPQASPLIAVGTNGLMEKYNSPKKKWELVQTNTEWCLTSTAQSDPQTLLMGGYSTIKRAQKNVPITPVVNTFSKVEAISMVNTSEGYLVADEALYKTENGGSNWKKMTVLEQIRDEDLYDVYTLVGKNIPSASVAPIEKLKIWVAAELINSSTNINDPVWQKLPNEWAESFSRIIIKTASNKVDKVGFAVGVNRYTKKGSLYRTLESGISWRPMDVIDPAYPTTQQECGGIEDIGMFDDKTIIVLCKDSKVFVSSDRGENFVFSGSFPEISGANRINISGEFGYIDDISSQDTNKKVVLITRNGGNVRLNLVQLKTGANTSDLIIVSDGTILSIADDNGVYRAKINKANTSNLTFTKVSDYHFSAQYPKHSVSQTDGSIWKTSSAGLVLSTDNGSSWKNINLPEGFDSRNGRGLFSLSKDKVWITNDKLNIYMSADGGTSWRDISGHIYGTSIEDIYVNPDN